MTSSFNARPSWPRRWLRALAGWRPPRPDAPAAGVAAPSGAAALKLGQPAAATLALRAAAHTDTGPVRTNNEDCVRCVLEDAGALGQQVSLVVVADGMGGHQAGEVASKTLVDRVSALWRQRGAQAPGVVLRSAIEAAHAQVYATACARPECQGMGTTVVALALLGDEAVVAHVGDSRAYLWRQSALQALSEDDTLVNHLLRQGLIAAEQAASHPDHGVLTQALGTRAQAPQIHVSAPMALQAGDVFLLCSDGVHDVLSAAVLARLLGEPETLAQPGATALRLAQAAIAAGTRDNVSVALVCVQHGPADQIAVGAPPVTRSASDSLVRPTRPMQPVMPMQSMQSMQSIPAVTRRTLGWPLSALAP